MVVNCAKGTTPVIFGYNGRDGVVTDANGLLYMRARYYSPTFRRFLNADVIPGSIDNSPTLNRYAYANGNPVRNAQSYIFLNSLASSDNSTFSDSLTSSDDSVVSETKDESLSSIVDVSSESLSIFNQTLKTSFRHELWFGNASITGLYSDWNARAQISLKKGTFKAGIAGKTSLINASGQWGFGTEDLNLSVKAVADVGTVTGMAGIFIDPKKNDYFVGVEAKATALSGRIGGQLDIFGAQVEAGVSGELASIGGRFGIGYKDGEIYFGAGFALEIGWDAYIRIRVDELFG